MQQVMEFMSRDVFAVGPDTSLETAARLLAQRRISGAPVIDKGRVVGVISASDLVDPDCDVSGVPGYASMCSASISVERTSPMRTSSAPISVAPI